MRSALREMEVIKMLDKARALRADPAIMRVALSARICLSQEYLDTAASSEGKNGNAATAPRKGKAKLHVRVNETTATIKKAQAGLERRKLAPMNCEDALVRDVAGCLGHLEIELEGMQLFGPAPPHPDLIADNLIPPPRACRGPLRKYALALIEK